MSSRRRLNRRYRRFNKILYGRHFGRRKYTRTRRYYR